jgi:hypothetical protein
MMLQLEVSMAKSTRAQNGERRKVIAFEADTWHALALLARDSMKTLQELADEAFTDLLRKHRRPLTLKDALRDSMRMQPANDPAPKPPPKPQPSGGSKENRPRRRRTRGR